jgi:sortase A
MAGAPRAPEAAGPQGADGPTTRSRPADAPRIPAGRGRDFSPRGRRTIVVARTRNSVRRGRRALALLLIVAGALLLADGAATLLWKEPLSSLYAQRQQATLEHRLTDLQHASAATFERRAPARGTDARRRLALAARAFERQTHTGQPLARLRIPALGVSAVVVEGTRAGELRDGPGHYPATSLPGEGRTVAIAGHRTTFGAWFRHIDRLRPPDAIEVDLPYGHFTYRVQRTRIVKPTALWITRNAGYDRLVLSACHPVFSASKRIVVFARLAGAQLAR